MSLYSGQIGEGSTGGAAGAVVISKLAGSVLLNLLLFALLLLLRHDPLLLHADLEALPQPALLAEPACDLVHLTRLVERTPELLGGEIYQLSESVGGREEGRQDKEEWVV